MKAHRFAVLDGMRGVAAVAVLTIHAGDLFQPFRFRSGYLAVDLFFVLSGFVIAHSYENRGLSAVQFLKVRWRRLYPLYALGTLAGALVAMIVPGTVPPAFVPRALALNLALLPAFGTGLRLFPLDFPAWSLMFEALANVAYAYGKRFMSVLIVACAIGMVIAERAYGSLAFGVDFDRWWIGLLRVGFAFPLGLLLYRLPRWKSWPAALPLGLTAVCLAVPSNGMFDLAFILVGCPLLVQIGASCRTQGGLFEWMGEVSYPLYVLHAPLLLIVVGMARGCGVDLTVYRPFSGALFLVAAVGIAAMAARFFDQPVRAAWRGRVVAA
jgi:peptidoglycan/LPS O-acetylase OafA/YrhL